MTQPYSVPDVKKPFPEFKWRWMEYTPEESFNRPDILLGISRAIAKCEGKKASSPEFLVELRRVQKDLLPGGSPKLVPQDPSRNVIRRQGRYWRGLGILAPASNGVLKLTKLGQKWADGSMSNDDFVSHTVRHHSLPNHVDAKNAKQWSEAGIEVRPLRLILQVLLALATEHEAGSEGLTANELRRVVVPLSIVTDDAAELARAVLAFRKAPSQFNKLPNCAPKENDPRMVHEHLLFLHRFGWLGRTEEGARDDRQYFIAPTALDLVYATLRLSGGKIPKKTEVASEKNIFVPEQKPRETVVALRLARDSRFKKDVLSHCGGKCLLTKESLRKVLVACHIHEVRDSGSDESSNGIILRADLHILFDANRLRISESGDVVLSPDVARATSYSALPKKVTIPQQVNKDLLRRRFLYGRVIL